MIVHKSNRQCRQRIRMGVILFTFLLFPIVMNFLSTYVIIDGALEGIITGSFILFCALSINSLLVGRLWCSWTCPAAGLQEAAFKVNPLYLTETGRS